MDEHIPSWLMTPEEKRPVYRRSSLSAEQRAEYERIFPDVLDRLNGGERIRDVFECDFEDWQRERSRFINWIMSDPDRKAAYREAKCTATEVMSEDLLDISDDNSRETNDRKLMIDTRKYLMASHNRDVYGDTKKVDTTIHLDISGAINDANKRIESIPAEYEVIDGNN